MAIIKDNEHQPDVEGNSKNGLEGNLPDAGTTTGLDASSGSMGDCDADCLAGNKGYHTVGIAGGSTDQREGDELGYAPTQTNGGVVGRAGGWER